MKKIIIILFAWLSISCAQQNIDHSVFTELLKEYNHNGYLDYEALTNENKLDEYLKMLVEVNPNKFISGDSRMAFWINVYNAFTIKAIVDNYPIESINDLHSGGRVLGHILSTTIWDDDFIIIDGKEYSLNDIEHEILRKDFNEPRIHFAIVCASISCPLLRTEAFDNERLNFQLEEQAIQFFNDESRNKFDLENKTAYLSKILDWFEEDFGENDMEVLLFVSNYIGEEIAKNIMQNVDEWSIEYLDYDWGLNEYKKN